MTNKKTPTRVVLEPTLIEKIEELRAKDGLLELEFKNFKSVVNEILLLYLNKIESYQDVVDMKNLLYNGISSETTTVRHSVPIETKSEPKTEKLIENKVQNSSVTSEDGHYEEDLAL